MYVCIYVCVGLCIIVCIHVCMYIHLCMCVHTYVSMYDWSIENKKGNYGEINLFKVRLN